MEHYCSRDGLQESLSTSPRAADFRKQDASHLAGLHRHPLSMKQEDYLNINFFYNIIKISVGFSVKKIFFKLLKPCLCC